MSQADQWGAPRDIPPRPRPVAVPQPPPPWESEGEAERLLGPEGWA
jgi:hypothetical protein